MPEKTPVYDLMLLLSTSGEDDRRAKILSEVENAITSGGGSVERKNDWGVRPMAFRIRHQSDADYHLLQFTGPVALLDSLSHSLRINDGVLRFRIIKLLPGMPEPSDSAPPVIAAAAHGVASTSPGPASPASATPASASPAQASPAGSREPEQEPAPEE